MSIHCHSEQACLLSRRRISPPLHIGSTTGMPCSIATWEHRGRFCHCPLMWIVRTVPWCLLSLKHKKTVLHGTAPQKRSECKHLYSKHHCRFTGGMMFVIDGSRPLSLWHLYHNRLTLSSAYDYVNNVWIVSVFFGVILIHMNTRMFPRRIPANPQKPIIH